MTLLQKAKDVREKAYAPYSKFKVGAAVRTQSGKEYSGCNVENVAYPQGLCAEAGAIASMIAGGDDTIVEIAVIADTEEPVSICGGCRQKLSEFAAPDTPVTMSTMNGKEHQTTLGDLIPGVFQKKHLPE